MDISEMHFRLDDDKSDNDIPIDGDIIAWRAHIHSRHAYYALHGAFEWGTIHHPDRDLNDPLPFEVRGYVCTSYSGWKRAPTNILFSVHIQWGGINWMCGLVVVTPGMPNLTIFSCQPQQGPPHQVMHTEFWTLVYYALRLHFTVNKTSDVPVSGKHETENSQSVRLTIGARGSA